MKLHEHAQPDLNTITAYGQGYVEVNARRHAGAVLVMPVSPVRGWTAGGLEAVDAACLAELVALEPEIVLLGTGAQQRFLHPRVLAPLTDAGIGHETMTTPSACRTYNILMAEGRRVLAALLPIGE